MPDNKHVIKLTAPLMSVCLRDEEEKTQEQKECPFGRKCRAESLDRREQELDAREEDLSERWAHIQQRERRASEQCERLGQLLESLRTAKADMLADNEETIVTFTLSVARKVLQYEVDNGHYKIEEIVRSALETVRNESEATVRVHPDDYELVRRAVEESAPHELQISVVADPNVARAACCIQTNSGNVVSDVEARLERVEQSLLKKT